MEFLQGFVWKYKMILNENLEFYIEFPYITSL